jgi:pimeloyl-ACP methyl ester carboxylesterase
MHPLAEVPMFFAASEETLFGVLTVAGGPPTDGVVVTVSSGGTPLSTSVNGISTRLCRRLATRGVNAFRFDYHGVGESTGELERFHLSRPFTVDLLGAVDHLAGLGLSQMVVVGSCFGARTALSSAASVEDLAGLVLLSPPVRDFEMGERTSVLLAAELSLAGYVRRAVKISAIRGLLSRQRRGAYRRHLVVKVRTLRSRFRRGPSVGSGNGDASGLFVDPLRRLADRGVPVLILYGEDDDLLQDFLRAEPQLRRVFALPSARIEIRRVAGSIHGFTRVEAQDDVVAVVEDWVVEVLDHERAREA